MYAGPINVDPTWTLLKTDALVKYTKYSLAGITEVQTTDRLTSEIKPQELVEKKNKEADIFNATAVTTRTNSPS